MANWCRLSTISQEKAALLYKQGHRYCSKVHSAACTDERLIEPPVACLKDVMDTTHQYYRGYAQASTCQCCSAACRRKRSADIATGHAGWSCSLVVYSTGDDVQEILVCKMSSRYVVLHKGAHISMRKLQKNTESVDQLIVVYRYIR